MDKAELLQRLRATFRLELQDHLSVFGRGLLSLEAGQSGDARVETLKALFRAAHSLKGAARAVDYPQIAELCHAMEELLGSLDEAAPATTPDLFELLFRCVDALSEADKRTPPEASLDVLGVKALVDALNAAAAGAQFSVPSSASAEPPPASPVAPPPAGRAPVEMARLDALLTRSAELLVERGRVRARAEQLTDAAERLAVWQRGFLPSTLRMQALLRRLDPSEPGVLEAISTLEHGRRTLSELTRDLDGGAAGLAREVGRLDRVAEPLEYQIRHVRMLPFSELEPRLQRAARDAAAEAGRRVRLELEGGAVEADRAVLEGLKDPLEHLVRNAVVHGVEPAEVRLAAGKPADGVVRVKAALRGPNVEVSVEDDGAGVDLASLREAAGRRGVNTPTQERELLRLVFVSELSTRSEVSQMAGRGVGLDVVLSAVESLHGSVDIHSAPSEGTRFTMLLPLTLTRLRALTLRAGAEVLCAASSNVVRLLRVGADALRRVEGRDMLSLDGELMPLVDLAESLGLPADPRQRPQQKLNVVVLVGADRRAAFVVDEFLAEREVVIQNLGPRLRRVRGLAGGTVLASGRVGLILHVGELVRDVFGTGLAGRVKARLEAPQQHSHARLLVVDDSPTTRALVASVLQGAGYHVVTMTDGAAALEELERNPYDLVVTDVEMPTMTGFELTRAIRASSFRDLPVILVTGLEGPEDRARGLDAGANAYLPKASFDQSELLETVAQLV